MEPSTQLYEQSGKEMFSNTYQKCNKAVLFIWTKHCLSLKLMIYFCFKMNANGAFPHKGYLLIVKAN